MFEQLWVVTRKDDAQVATLLSTTRAHLLQAADADKGMGHSLAAAARDIQRQHTGALVVGLADMPYVARQTLSACVDRLSELQPAERRVVQPRYEGQPGNPVGFSAALVPELANCHGDEGARQLVKQAKADKFLSYLEVDDPGVLHDIDTPAGINDSKG